MPNLISFTDKGLFCEAGSFYIDPWLPVDRAVITQATVIMPVLVTNFTCATNSQNRFWN